VSDLTIDGSLAAFNTCSPGYVGIFYRASSGAIQSIHVTHIHHPWLWVSGGSRYLRAKWQRRPRTEFNVNDSSEHDRRLR